MHVSYGSSELRSEYQTGDSQIASLPLKNLTDNALEEISFSAHSYRETKHFKVWQQGDLILGLAHPILVEDKIVEITESIYDELFEIARDAELYRIWNYVPQINVGQGDQERYRRFCVGRSQSFHRTYGQKDITHMPAGSCVGVDGDEMIIIFLAGKEAPTHHENPNQTPAYRYPRQFGPQAPSFARATSVALGDRHLRFISGTASVIGHESVGAGDISQQLHTTCDNIETISHKTVNGRSTSITSQSFVSGKVYLRQPSDLATAREILAQRFPEIENRLIYLRSDICRKELLVEMELNFCD